MIYRGYKITEEYNEYGWHDPDACDPVTNTCKSVKDAKEQIDEHLRCIDNGELSGYDTEKHFKD